MERGKGKRKKKKEEKKPKWKMLNFQLHAPACCCLQKYEEVAGIRQECLKSQKKPSPVVKQLRLEDPKKGSYGWFAKEYCWSRYALSGEIKRVEMERDGRYIFLLMLFMMETKSP